METEIVDKKRVAQGQRDDNLKFDNRKRLEDRKRKREEDRVHM